MWRMYDEHIPVFIKGKSFRQAHHNPIAVEIRKTIPLRQRTSKVVMVGPNFEEQLRLGPTVKHLSINGQDLMFSQFHYIPVGDVLDH